MKIPRTATNVRIEDRKSYVVVLFDYSIYKDCVRKFNSMELAQRFIAGEEIMPEIKKGARVQITFRAKYNGKDEPWTERQSRTETLSVPIAVYHFGVIKNGFYPKATCFYVKWPDRKNEVPSGAYLAEIPAGTVVEYYDDDEVRIDLSQSGIKIYRIITTMN